MKINLKDMNETYVSEMAESAISELVLRMQEFKEAACWLYNSDAYDKADAIKKWPWLKEQ